MSRESNKEWLGLELIKESEALKHEFNNKSLKRGLIYVHLNSLEDDGLISSRVLEEDDDRNQYGIIRRVYKMSNSGRDAYRAHIEENTKSEDKGWFPDDGTQPA